MSYSVTEVFVVTVKNKFPVVFMKNKESRSAANGFTSISAKISAKEKIYTSTCVARKSR